MRHIPVRPDENRPFFQGPKMQARMRWAGPGMAGLGMLLLALLYTQLLSTETEPGFLLRSSLSVAIFIALGVAYLCQIPLPRARRWGVSYRVVFRVLRAGSTVQRICAAAWLFCNVALVLLLTIYLLVIAAVL